MTKAKTKSNEPGDEIQVKQFSVLYGNTEKGTIEADNLLDAQKSAYEQAVQKKTTVVFVNELN